MTKIDRYLQMPKEILSEEGYDSRINIEESFSTPLNWDVDHFRQKLQLFSPYFMQMSGTYEKPRVAEIWSGNGTFLDLASRDLPGCTTRYVAGGRNSAVLFRHLYGEGSPHELVEGVPEDESVDIAISDAALNHMDDGQVESFVRSCSRSLARGGILCLLVNMDPDRTRQGFDLPGIHSMMSGLGLTCVFGMNTFSSLWLKS
jgi:SAM-dependent methyltransferase